MRIKMSTVQVFSGASERETTHPCLLASGGSNPCSSSAYKCIIPVSVSIFASLPSLCLSVCPFLALTRTFSLDSVPILIQYSVISIFIWITSVKTLFTNKVLL